MHSDKYGERRYEDDKHRRRDYHAHDDRRDSREDWIARRKREREEAPIRRSVWERSPSPTQIRVQRERKERREDSKRRSRDGSEERPKIDVRKLKSKMDQLKESNADIPGDKIVIDLENQPSKPAESNRQGTVEKSNHERTERTRKRSPSPDSDSDSSSSSSSPSSSSSSSRERRNRKNRKSKRKHDKKRRPLERSESSDSSSESNSKASRERKKRKKSKSSKKVIESNVRNSKSIEGSVSHDKELPNVAVDENESDGDELFGPRPLEEILDENRTSYGGNLLKGEGTAMAEFVKSGERIPRRGEIGLTSNEITTFEKSGFVMSGSRSKRMNAVRLRKENQVYSVEEKKMMIKMAMEEKAKRENAVLAGLMQMVNEKELAARQEAASRKS